MFICVEKKTFYVYRLVADRNVLLLDQNLGLSTPPESKNVVN